MDSTQQLAAHFCTLNTLVEDTYLVPPRTTIKKTLASIKEALDAPLKAHARECADIPDNAFWMECWMARFELLTPFKNILQRCYQASAKNPIILLDQPQHIYWNFHTMVLQRPGIAPEQVLSKTLFLTSAYLAAMPAWLTDQTPDLAETTPILTRRIHDPSFISFLKELV